MSTDILYRVAVSIHVLSAVVWVGGVLFMGMIAVPAAKRFDDELRRKLLDVLGRRFRPVGWTCLALLVLTGGWLMWNWGARWDTLVDLSFFDHAHTQNLGYKLILVAVMLVVSGLHDFWLGPRATEEGRTDEEIAKDRKLAGWLGRITGILVILIVVLAVTVARPWA